MGRVQACFVLGYSAPFSYQAHALVNHLSLWDLNLLNLWTCDTFHPESAWKLETCKEKDSPALPSSSLSINSLHPPLETCLQTQTSTRAKLTSHLSKIVSNLYDPVHKPLTPFEPPLTLSSSAELLCVCVPSITPSHTLDLLIHLFVKKQFKHTNSLFTLLSGSTPKKDGK